MTSYCHNCGHFLPLTDHVHCAYCLTFWYGNGRMPLKSDYAEPLTAIQRLYQSIGWDSGTARLAGRR